MASGDHCFTITIADRKIVEHRDCDEYVDGTWTDPMAITRSAALITGAEKRRLISAAVSLGERLAGHSEERPVTGQGQRMFFAATVASPLLDWREGRPPRLILRGEAGDELAIVGTLPQLTEVVHQMLALIQDARAAQ